MPQGIEKGDTSPRAAINVTSKAIPLSESAPIQDKSQTIPESLLLERPPAKRNPSRLPIMASVAMENGTKSGKTVEWIEVSRKRPKKNAHSGTTYPPPLKNSHKPECRIIFQRNETAPTGSPLTAQDILHAMNMKLLSMKVPAHLRLTELKYNNCGSLTGLSTAQTTACAIFSRSKEIILQVALRYDADIKRLVENQIWIYQKAHVVALGRHYIGDGLDRIREEVRAGPSALELHSTPRWVSGNERMDHIAKNGLRNNSSISFAVRTATESDRVKNRASILEVSFIELIDMLGLDQIQCVQPATIGDTPHTAAPRLRKYILQYLQNHILLRTINVQLMIVNRKRHRADASKSPDYKQAISIACNGRVEWEDGEKEQERRNLIPDEFGDSDSIYDNETRQNE